MDQGYKWDRGLCFVGGSAEYRSTEKTSGDNEKLGRSSEGVCGGVVGVAACADVANVAIWGEGGVVVAMGRGAVGMAGVVFIVVVVVLVGVVLVEVVVVVVVVVRAECKYPYRHRGAEAAIELAGRV